MVNPNLTEVIAVLDRSGSMSLAIQDVLGNYNRFVKEQREGHGECRFTLVIFDNQIDTVYEARNVHEIEDLTEETYFARNMTALYDAIGTAINRAGERYSAMPEHERPGKVVVFISTDGMENASKEFTNQRLKQMIETQTNEFSWEFIFTGANIDSDHSAGQINIKRANITNYSLGTSGVACLYKNVSQKLRAYRSGDVQCMSFTPEERAEIESHIGDDDDLSKNQNRSATFLRSTGAPVTP
jgi:hypothetical protein